MYLWYFVVVLVVVVLSLEKCIVMFDFGWYDGMCGVVDECCVG